MCNMYTYSLATHDTEIQSSLTTASDSNPYSIVSRLVRAIRSLLIGKIGGNLPSVNSGKYTVKCIIQATQAYRLTQAGLYRYNI